MTELELGICAQDPLNCLDPLKPTPYGTNGNLHTNHPPGRSLSIYIFPILMGEVVGAKNAVAISPRLQAGSESESKQKDALIGKAQLFENEPFSSISK